MQQKTKFIILIALICFISLLFFPGKGWSSNNNSFPGGGTSPCGTPIKKCSAGHLVWHPASGTPGTGSYSPAGNDFVCTSWETLDENLCSSGGDGEDKEPGYNCNNSTGECYYVENGASYSTRALAQCEANCRLSGTYLHCRPPLTTLFGADSNKEYCKQATWYDVNPGNECKVDADCQVPAPPPTTPKYSCNTSTWTCSQDSNGVYSSLATCQSNCVKPSTTITCPGSSDCYKCNTSYQCVKSSTGQYTSQSKCLNNCIKPSTTPTSPPPTSPPPTSPPPTCQIISFTINEKNNSSQNPLIVWVNASLTGYFSVLDSCQTCTVSSNDTWGNPLKTYPISSLTSSYTETFKINTAGTYSYILTCQGQDPTDIVTDSLSLQTVKALNLPWWREIIPVLPGFLRGLWK